MEDCQTPVIMDCHFAGEEYIGFVDSDDYVDKRMYELMYTKANEDDSDMVHVIIIWYMEKKKNS